MMIKLPEKYLSPFRLNGKDLLTLIVKNLFTLFLLSHQKQVVQKTMFFCIKNFLDALRLHFVFVNA